MYEKIKTLIKKNDFATASELFSNMNEVDIADVISEISEKDAVKLFRTLKKDDASEVFAHMESEMQQAIIESITDKEITGIIEDMFLDDVVDFIEEMPANVVKKVLANVVEEKRALINQFLQYPEDSVGSIMTIEFVDLKEDITVGEAFDYIRKTGVDKETIYTCYVITKDRTLIGAVSAKTLLLSNTGDRIGDIMDSNIIYAHTTDDQEDAVNDFRKYGFLAMPVVDKEKRLVGIITFDDAVQVIEEENTEDFEKMAALSPSDEPYLKTGVFKLSGNRLLWLLLLMLSATITGSIITGFEDLLAALPVLMSFVPMLMDTGGNAGSQASTLVIRGMALEEIRTKDMFLVIWKELRVSVICGVALALINFVRIYLMNGRNAYLAGTVSLTVLATVMIAKIVGCVLPIAAKKLRLDPAIMAAPLITTIVDATALIVYFYFAKLVLHM